MNIFYSSRWRIGGPVSLASEGCRSFCLALLLSILARRHPKIVCPFRSLL